MIILVSAIEVGSVNAMIPVCIQLIKTGNKLIIEKKGYFSEKIVEELSSYVRNIPEDENKLKHFLKKENIDKVLFSVNVADARPLRIARIAKYLKIETFHLLDYWYDYRARMERDGEKMLVPTRYFVPDEFALKKAIEEGVPEEVLRVTGQPALADVDLFYKAASNANDPFFDLKKQNKRIFLFISEPVSLDQGRSFAENKKFRGYTEDDVLKTLINALALMDNNYYIILLPHPRQDSELLIKYWESIGGNKFGSVYTNVNSRSLLPFAEGVIGMASTLLFEAWLVGKTVLSIQPNLSNNPLEMLENQIGFDLINNYENSNQMIVKWFSKISSLPIQKFRNELQDYKNSSKNVVREMNRVY